MRFADYVQLLRDQWKTVIVFAIAGALIGAAVFFVRPQQYSSSLELYVSAQLTQGENAANAAYEGSLFTQQRVKSYTELITSDRVLGEVSARLGLPGEPADLAEHLEVSAAVDSVLIDVTATADDPEAAARLASTVGTVFIEVVDDLERPTVPGTPRPIVVRPVAPAVPPLEPSSSGLPSLAALGLLACTALGIGFSYVRSVLDTSVTTPESAAEAGGAPSLGVVGYDSALARETWHLAEGESPTAEAYRQIRTNLQFVDVDQAARVLVVTSPLPGEGKTTTTLNVARALGSSGHRVIVVDGDLRRPRVAELLQLEPAVGVTNVLASRLQVEGAIQKRSRDHFDVLVAGPLPPNPSELLGSQPMAQLLRDLAQRYDYVLVDSPPVLPVTDAAAVAPASDGVLLVCRAGKTTVQQVASAATSLRTASGKVVGVVLSMAPTRGVGARAQYNSYYASNTARPTSKSTSGSMSPADSSTTDQLDRRAEVGANFMRPSPRRRA